MTATETKKEIRKVKKKNKNKKSKKKKIYLNESS